MSGPWEKYKSKEPAGPWTKYQKAAPKAEAPQSEGRGFFRRVDDAVRGAADMLTFGLADEISAGMDTLTGTGAGGSYDENLAAQRQRDSEGGWERFGGQLAGAVAMPARLATSIPKAIGQGAATGAAYGFGSGEDGFANRAQDAALGGAIGGAAGGVIRGATNALQTRAAAKTIPTNDDLRKAATAAYNRADAAGVIIKPEGMQKLGTSIVGDLAEFGYDPALQPGVAAVLKRLEDAGNTNITLKGLDVIRKVAGNAAKIRDNPSQQALAAKIIDRIDDYIDALPAEDVLTGNAKQGAKALSEAREMWGRLRKSEVVDAAALKAERRAASTGSGANADNAMRQNVRGLLDNPRTARGMTEAEKAAAETVVRGTVPQNALRLAGKAAPTGIVSGGIGTTAGATIGAALAGPGGAGVGAVAIPALGKLAKNSADALTQRNVERLSQVIRSGGRTASDLAALTRGGQLPIEQVQRLEKFGKRIGISVPELAAMLRERMAGEAAPAR